MDPNAFIGSCGEPVEVEKEQTSYSYTSIVVLPELIGKKWDDISLAFVLSLGPKYIRVTDGSVTLDSRTRRVTVTVNDLDDLIIEKVSMEVCIPLPEGVNNGHCLNLALKRGRDSKEFRFFNRDGIVGILHAPYGTSVTFDDGTRSSFEDFE